MPIDQNLIDRQNKAANILHPLMTKLNTKDRVGERERLEDILAWLCLGNHMELREVHQSLKKIEEALAALPEVIVKLAESCTKQGKEIEEWKEKVATLQQDLFEANECLDASEYTTGE